MKQILHGEYLLQEVPEEIKDVHLYRVNNEAIMLKWTDVKHPLNVNDVIRVDYYRGDLNDYKWPVIIGKADELDNWEEMGLGVAIFKSHNLKPETTLILKKEK